MTSQTQQLITPPQHLLNNSTNKLLDDFGAGLASPGSGSATALLSLISLKMLITVCDISLKKPQCIQKERFKYIIEQSKTFELRLKNLFEQDAKDFEEVIKLRKQRDNETDKSRKTQLSKSSLNLLEKTTNYVFDIAKISIELTEYGIFLFKNGWPTIRGDSGVAISAALSATMSSIFIISLNLKTLKRRKYARNNQQTVNKLIKDLNKLQKQAFECVTELDIESTKAIQSDLKLI